jgi:two-component system, cell cycle sensor histidine kinase and response regulator CckA
MPEQRSAREPVGRGRTIFFLDDDLAVRHTVRRILELHGFRVLEAGDAQEALEVLRTHPDPVDLLICDLVLPGLSGREAANILVARRPEAKVLYTSGFSSHDSFRRKMEREGAPFLSKPFEVPELLEAVGRLLDD